MKILFVVTAFGIMSGAEQVLLDYLKSEDRIQPVFLLIGKNRDAVDFFSDVAVSKDIFFVESGMKLDSTFSRFFTMGLKRIALLQVLKSDETVRWLQKDPTIQAVYFNNSFETAMFSPLFEGKKRVAHIHDMIDMLRPAHKYCVLRGCSKAEKVITVSEAAKNQLVRNGIDGDKITVVHNGFPCEPVPYRGTEETGAITLGFVGSAIKRKGLDTFCLTVNALLKKLRANGDERQMKAMIITNSIDEDSYFRESIAAIDPSITVSVFRRLEREVVFKKYEQMDVLLVPSRNDPLPTVIIEALLKGTPVMGSDKDGIPEMLPCEEMLFEVGNAEEAAEKLMLWLSQPLSTKEQIMNVLQTHIQNAFSPVVKKNRVMSVLTSL